MWLFLSIILITISRLSSHNVDSTLLFTVKQAVGVYLHPRNQSLPSQVSSYFLGKVTERHQTASQSEHNPAMEAILSNTVIVTGFNYGYSNHLMNFKCFLERLDLKFIAIAMDERAYNTALNVSEHMIPYLWRPKTPNGIKVEESATKFRSAQFNLMSMIKIESVSEIMSLGYHVIFIDPDIAVVRDPTPYMIFEGIDYVHSHNKICPQCYEWDFKTSEEEGNTGMYFVRSNQRTIKLFETVIADVPKYPNYDDQSIFWFTLRAPIKDLTISPKPKCSHISPQKDSSNMVVTCPLDGCMFSAGALRGVAYDWLRDNLNTRHLPLVSVHANYLKGNELKYHALKKHGYWITHYPSHICQAFTPLF